jgi:hypothetical protein
MVRAREPHLPAERCGSLGWEMWLYGREMWLSGREMWLSRPGDVALSCNPSYLGGQSSGMV